MSKTVDPATTHRWVGAATIPLTPQQAKTADLRGSFIVKADSRITVVEAYCAACRRPYDDCADAPCVAVDSRTNEHLRGGPIGERKKRRHRGCDDPVEAGTLDAAAGYGPGS